MDLEQSTDIKQSSKYLNTYLVFWRSLSNVVDEEAISQTEEDTADTDGAAIETISPSSSVIEKSNKPQKNHGNESDDVFASVKPVEENKLRKELPKQQSKPSKKKDKVPPAPDTDTEASEASKWKKG